MADKRSDFFPFIYNALMSFCGALVCVLALSGFGRDYAAALVVGLHGSAAIAASQQWQHSKAEISVFGASVMIKNCANILTNDESVKISSELSSSARESCAAMADALLLRAPSSGRARALRLLARPQSITPQTYGLAQTSAPFEPWPMGIRFLAAERLAGHQTKAFEQTLRQLVARDIDRLLAQSAGQGMLAQVYRRHSPLRALIAERLDAAPTTDQHAFLRALKRLGQG